MYRVAWFTCALLCAAGASARVLDRCELARELSELGVRPDHLSTWVCIAYHESRFDTNANNPYSGDHGIFQISELYWCGAGKACGLPCAALHDDDIADDLDCALIVYEEHTRLQGNGFLAWVVYPQHCKQNTKKYLVDCDLSSKNSVLLTRSRGFQYVNSFNQPNVTTNRQNIEKLLPPYLSIGNIVRENYGKVLDQSKGRTDWYNYKFDNIDELKLPVFNQPSQHLSMTPTTSTPHRTTTTTTTTIAPRRTTTATTEYVPRVKVWRVIETNQFRKKKKFGETSEKEEKPTIKPEYTNDRLERYTQSTKVSTAIQLPSTTIRPLTTTATTARVATTTARVTTTTRVRPTTKTTVTTTAYRSPTSKFAYRLPSSTTTYKSTTSSTTYRPLTSVSTFNPFTFTTTYRPFSTTRQWHSTTTRKPTTSAVTPRTVTTSYRPPTTTTAKPSTTTTRKPTTAWTWSSTSSKKPTVATLTTKPKSDFSWHTFTSRTATTPVTTKLQPFAKTTQPFSFTTKTQKNAPTITTKAVTYSTTAKPPTTTQKPKTTQSIFDLYLNPTKAPQLPSYKYNWGQSKLKIFAGGTTTTPATIQSTPGRGENSNGAAKNFIKRQA